MLGVSRSELPFANRELNADNKRPTNMVSRFPHLGGEPSMNFKSIASLACLTLAHCCVDPGLAQQPKTGFQSKVKVGAATRLDWIFALSNKSMEKAPGNWLPADYDSTKQQY